MMVTARHITLEQGKETPLQVVKGAEFSFRYACTRSFDSRQARDPGQDYLTLALQEGSFIFCIGDGVSQSFFGDLASRLLGDALVVWLQQKLPTGLEKDAVEKELASFLQSETAAITEKVMTHALPGSLPPMLRDVLEQKRAHGSDTMFICGRLDAPSGSLPQGRIVLAWMGDMRLRGWKGESEITSRFGGAFTTSQRWSSLRGPVNGSASVYVSPLYAGSTPLVTRLMAYSDGLSSLDGKKAAVPARELEEMIEKEGQSPASDDISFLEVWPGEMPEGLE